MKSISKLALTSLVFVAGMMSGSVLMSSARAEPQPAMDAALAALKTAEGALSKADTDKGGHRVKALDHTRKAIEQVEKGIKFDNKH